MIGMLNHNNMLEAKIPQICLKSRFDTYLFLLLIEVVYNDTNEEIECEKCSKYDENNKITVHI